MYECVCVHTQCCAVCHMVSSFAVLGRNSPTSGSGATCRPKDWTASIFSGSMIVGLWTRRRCPAPSCGAAVLRLPRCVPSACAVVTFRVQKHNQAHCINHSCDPNCYAKILTIDGKKKCDRNCTRLATFSHACAPLRIVIYAKYNLQKGTELTCVCIEQPWFLCVFIDARAQIRLQTQR